MTGAALRSASSIQISNLQDALRGEDQLGLDWGESAMLIYANSFLFEPAGGPAEIIQLVARWVGQRAKSFVDGDRLAAGIRELRLKDGSTLTSKSTTGHEGAASFPYLFSAQLSHRDAVVSGRK